MMFVDTRLVWQDQQVPLTYATVIVHIHLDPYFGSMDIRLYTHRD